MTDNNYVEALEIEADYWRKKYEKANARAIQWARMYDELQELKNDELDDDNDE